MMGLRQFIAIQVFLLSCLATKLFDSYGMASDHADPLFSQRQEGGITDLFAFVSEDSEILTLIVCVRRALLEQQALPLDQYTYHIYLDLHSQIAFDNREGTLARYGGRVVHPTGIEEDVSIRIKLHSEPVANGLPGFQADDAQRLATTLIRDVRISGLQRGDVKVWAGIRDDPFIFHRFSNTNCVGMVLDIPLKLFPAEQEDFLIWATTEDWRGNQIDHVGRSLRTMLPRLDRLNTIHPRRHVETLQELDRNPGVVSDLMRSFIPPLFGLRSYDFEPDVMILTRRQGVMLGDKPYPTSYPNGRLLTDDVAKLCCEQGDCLLYEVSLAEAHHDGVERPTKNNKEFLDHFPYLADPVDHPMAIEDPSLTRRTKIILGALVLATIAVVVALGVHYWRLRRELKDLRQRSNSIRPVDRLHPS